MKDDLKWIDVFWLVSQNNSLFSPSVKPSQFFQTIFDILLFIFSQQTAIFRNSSWYTAQISYRSHVIQERSTIHLKFHHSSHKQANTISFTAPAFVPVIGLCSDTDYVVWFDAQETVNWHYYHYLIIYLDALPEE